MILDGHNDLVLRAWRGETPRHIDLATAAATGFAGGFFALYVPGARRMVEPPRAPYALPLDDPIPIEEAAPIAEELAIILEGFGLPLARRVSDFVPGRITAIMHLEGADPLAPDLSDLERWYERGLRSIAVPIVDRAGEAIAGLNISTHSTRTTRNEMRDRFLPRLRAVAEQVSASLA